jgi:hypothetical protein
MQPRPRYPVRVVRPAHITLNLLTSLLLCASPVLCANAAVQPTLLKGGVSETVSPFAEDGSKNEVQAGVPLNLTICVNLNSELSKVGDGVVAMVSSDVKQDGKPVLPGQWWVGGKVTEVEGRRRLGRDGYISVHFEKLVSPDGKYEIPVDITASTKESTVKSVAKVVTKDTVMVTTGAAAGALLSVQVTGIPLAVATHGYSVAAGAAFGASVGLLGALKRKGKVTAAITGEELKFRLDKPVTLPAFNAAALPSAVPIPKVDNLDISVEKISFRPDPFGDKASRLLRVDFKFNNQTDHEYSFGNIAVVSDHNQMYYPYVLADLNVRQKRVLPKSRQAGTITFAVTSGKHKYWLVLLDRGNKNELARVPVN